MRKRQKLADATALSMELSLIEAKLYERRMTPADADAIDEVVTRTHALEKAKIIIAPQLLHRVKALAVVARRLRELQAQGSGQ